MSNQSSEQVNPHSVKDTTDPQADDLVNGFEEQDITASTEYTNKDGMLQQLPDEDRGIVINASDIHQGLLPTKKKKKKKSSKPASKRGLDKPTGFEEFHADAPLTPEQLAESREAFRDRILKAIQRFERTRKLSPERRDIFYKYLAYGGVDIGPNMFMGGQTVEDMDKDDWNAAIAQANISEATKSSILDPKKENENGSADAMTETSRLHSSEHMAKYVVDFNATMRGFMSRHAPTLFAFDSPDHVSLVTTTLERFMDYLLQHDVCSEYSKEVLETRDLCRFAQKELWECAEAQRHLPGDFNIACSTLFGGSYAQNYDGETYWGPTDSKDKVFVGIKPEQATQIVGFAIAGAASEDIYVKYLDIVTGKSTAGGFETVKVIEDHGFEITRIELPSRECKKLYKENTADFCPVGRVHAKFFPNPNAPPEDLTPAERDAIEAHSNHGTPIDHADEFLFFIESEPLLSLLRPGMRVEATVHELNCGVWFFDEITRVLPSFDLWLENELMLGWKEPRPVAGAPRLEFNYGASVAQDFDFEPRGSRKAQASDPADGVGIAAADGHAEQQQVAQDRDQVISNTTTPQTRSGHNDEEHPC